MRDQPNYNPPGRPALSYRVGTYSHFLDRMLRAVREKSLIPLAGEKKRPLMTLRACHEIT